MTIHSITEEISLKQSLANPIRTPHTVTLHSNKRLWRYVNDHTTNIKPFCGTSADINR